jgi:hypothetical protein
MPETIHQQMRRKAAQPNAFDLFASLFTTPTGSHVPSENWPVPLTVVRRVWEDPATSADDITNGLPADEVYLSADGRTFHTGWYRGVPTGESVYVEIRRRFARSFHGWVDADSRKIVQAG